MKCPYCDYTNNRTYRLRLHNTYCHPDKHPFDLEYIIIKERYPNLDIDLLIVRYLEKKETALGLQAQGLFVKHFLTVIGVARRPAQDNSLHGAIKWNNASEQDRFEGYVQANISKLRKAGVEDMDEAVLALRLIAHIKKKIAKAKEPEPEPEIEERLYK